MSQILAGTYTKREILSQPGVWAESLRRLQELDASTLPAIANYEQVVFSGCGSTHYLARWAAPVSESVHKTISRAVAASDLLLFPDSWLHPEKRTLLVSISRSGETTETIHAMERFLAAGLGDGVVITCYPQSRLAQLAAHVIVVPEAQEESVAQTRSFTSMLLAVLWLILRRVPEGLPSAFEEAGQRLIDQNLKMANRIGDDDSIQRLFYLGSGPLHGLANEAMLKMKEMSLSYAESFHFHEFRHGPMAMVDKQSLIVGLISDAAKEQQFAVLREMKALGARTLGLQDSDNPKANDALDDQVLFQSGIPEIWRAPLYLPVLQLIAYERAMHKGLNPDLPENLNSVVVLHDGLD